MVDGERPIDLINGVDDIISHGILASIRGILKTSVDIMRREEPKSVIENMSRRIRGPSAGDKRTVGGNALTSESKESRSWEQQIRLHDEVSELCNSLL